MTYPPAAGTAMSPAPIELLANEIALAASLEQMSEPALVTRSDLERPGPTIVAVNAAQCAMTQYSAAELIGRSPRVFQGPLTEVEVLARLRDSCTRGEPFIGETVNYRKDGTPFVLRWTIDPIRDEAGRITHFLALQRDITAQHRYVRSWFEAEANARAAMARSSAQMALISEAIMVLEKSKRSFRSKELGTLRERLTQAARAFAEDAARRIRNPD